MYCPKCGTRRPEQGRACAECGAPLNAFASSPGGYWEFKKLRLRYFTDEYAQWDAKYMLAPAGEPVGTAGAPTDPGTGAFLKLMT